MHQHPLVSYRVHADSRAGRQSDRQFVWAGWSLRLSARHEDLCPPQDRAFVRRGRRDAIWDYAYGAYYYARRYDAKTARRFLVWLLRQAPAEPGVAMAPLATWGPEKALNRALGALRAAPLALRRLGGSGR